MGDHRAVHRLRRSKLGQTKGLSPSTMATLSRWFCEDFGVSDWLTLSD